MNYIKLYESYKSQKEIEELSNYIIDRISSNTIEKLHNDKVKINHLSDVKLGDFNTNHFPLLGDFMKDYHNITISIVSNDQLGNYNMGNYINGVYLSTDIEKYIFLKLNKHIISDLNDLSFIGTLYKNRLELVNSKLSKSYSSTLVHELQHAYDDWRSNGISIKEPESYRDNELRSRELTNKDLKSLKEEELEFISKHHKDYLNLKFEVDARFTSAIKSLSFYDLDIDLSIEADKDIYTMNDFETVKSEFKIAMTNFKFLTEKEKWRVLRKFGQFYEIEREFVKKINNNRT